MKYKFYNEEISVLVDEEYNNAEA